MSHSDILAIFCEKFFDTYAVRIQSWAVNGKHSIKLRLENNQRLIFTYNSEYDWTLQAVRA